MIFGINWVLGSNSRIGIPPQVIRDRAAWEKEPWDSTPAAAKLAIKKRLEAKCVLGLEGPLTGCEDMVGVESELTSETASYTTGTLSPEFAELPSCSSIVSDMRVIDLRSDNGSDVQVTGMCKALLVRNARGEVGLI